MGNDVAGDEGCCVAAAMTAAEPATIGGAAAANAWPEGFCGDDADAACGTKPGGGASVEAAHWLGGGGVSAGEEGCW